MELRNPHLPSGDVAVLKQIVNEVFESDVESVCREKKYIFARYVYVKILRDLRYSSTQIGSSIKRNHSTVLHIEKNFKPTMDCYPNIYALYLRCKELYVKWKGEPSSPPNTKFEAEIYLLKSKVSQLESDNNRLLRIVERNKRVQDISDLLAARIPLGYEVKVGKEINKLLNGIRYDI